MDTFKHLKIRPATNNDAEAVTALVFGVLAEYGLTPDPTTTDADLRDVERNYRARGGCFEVVDDGRGRIVGSVGLYPLEEGTCELRKMYLAPEVRGIGLGKQLLERMIEMARELGFERIVLETANVLVEAIALYTSYGFQPVQADHLSARCDQAYELRL